MAKKKNTKKNQQHLSDEQYLRQRMRSLKLGDCYITSDAEEAGIAIVLVTRCHEQGKISVGQFLLDLFCLGLKDTSSTLRLDKFDYDDFIKHIPNLTKITYEEAHNRIYGAIAFAEEAGISPHRNWRNTQYFLEEDTDDIPLIEYAFGKDGQHFLMVPDKLEASRYLPILEAHLGDNYSYVIDGKDDETDENGYYDEEDWSDFAHEFSSKFNHDEILYTYQCPEYPTTLESVNPSIIDMLSKGEKTGLSKKQIDDLMALPHDELKHDLENVIMYYLGVCQQDMDSIVAIDLFNRDVLLNAIIMLGEVGDERSLDVIFEVLRQSPDFHIRQIGDLDETVFLNPVARLAENRLPQLTAFAKEIGLYYHSHGLSFGIMTHIVRLNPDRRKELIMYLREVFRHLCNYPDAHQHLRTEISFMICELADLGAIEAFDEIKEAYDNGLVLVGLCGSWETISADLKKAKLNIATEEPIDIYRQFDNLRNLLSD